MSRMTQRKQTTSIIVHCTATQAKTDWGAADVRRSHVVDRGWDDAGYHIIICRDGTVEYGRHISYVGAHAPKVNSTSVGVCLVGGAEEKRGRLVSKYNFTEEQLKSLAEVINKLIRRYPDIDTVTGHYQVDGAKDCPTFDVPEWYASGVIVKKEGSSW